MNADCVEFAMHTPDAGLTFTCQCPICHASLIIAERGWWGAKCQCGQSWRLNISITADKDTDA